MKIELKNMRLVSQIEEKDKVTRLDIVDVHAPGHELHGKKMFRRVVTPILAHGKYGKHTAYFSVEGHKEEYSDLEKFLKAHNIEMKMPEPPAPKTEEEEQKELIEYLNSRGVTLIFGSGSTPVSYSRNKSNNLVIHEDKIMAARKIDRDFYEKHTSV